MRNVSERCCTLNRHRTNLTIRLVELTVGGRQSGWIPKGDVQGDSLDVGAAVTYRGRACTVSTAVDDDGRLKVLFAPAKISADMTAADWSNYGIVDADATIMAAFMPKME